jgi:hypothetical protein
MRILVRHTLYQNPSSVTGQPELLFFAPGDASTSTTLYTCALSNGEAPSAARELLTLGNLSAAHVIVSPRPCHGLTLVSDGPASQHYVCNLSTGEHVALPPCERAAAVESPDSMRIGVAGRCFRPPPWVPFEVASTGLGFDPATGDHKVVRLFKKRIGETGCEVCTCTTPGGAWRPCAGRVPPPSASFIAGLPPVYLRGSLYFLLELNIFTGTDQPVMSFSVGAEQFGRVHMPPFLAQRVGTLTELDGSLCAVVDLRFDHERYSLYTWGGDGDTWSKRYWIDLQSLPQAISDEFVEEDDVIPRGEARNSCSPRALTRSSLMTPTASPWRGCCGCRSSSTSRRGAKRPACFSTLDSTRTASPASTIAATAAGCR